MAPRPFPDRLSVWAAVFIGLASGTQLGDDIEKLVPACARPCLVSFIEGNFPACGSTPSLQCLCTGQSTSGYTVGEGALECVSYGLDQGNCNLDDAGGFIKRDAYLMCSNIANAFPNTHSILTATIATGPSGAVSIVPSTSPQPSSTTLDTAPTSTGVGTMTIFPTSLPPTSGPSATSTAVDSSATSTPASTPVALTTAQIAGIVVGVVGAIGIALGAIFLARRIRRRRYPESEAGLLPMDEERGNSPPFRSGPAGALNISRPFRRFSNHQHDAQPPSSYRTPPPHTLTPPIPYTPPNRGFSPNYHNSPNTDRADIGLAISRSLNASPALAPDVPTQRPSSRLLPAKPALSLRIPPSPPPVHVSNTAAMRSSNSQRLRADRASVMTNATEFADVDTEATDGGQIWRPPPDDTLPATPSYAADRWRNQASNNNRDSRLGQVAEVAELDTYTPLTKSPLERREEEAIAAAASAAAASWPKRPPPAFMSRDNGNGGVNRSSSLYSQASVVPKSSRGLAGRKNSIRSRKGQICRSDSVMSHDSTTTIFDEEPPFELDENRPAQLTTVVEASPPLGRSPVQYPNIPGRLNRSRLQLAPPPKRPNFTNLAHSPPGQESPTLGATEIAEESDNPYPPPLNPRRSQWMNGIPEISLSPQYPGENATPTRAQRRDYTRPPTQNVPFNMPSGNGTPPPNYRRPQRLQTPPMQTHGSGFSPTPPTASTFAAPSPPPSSRLGTPRGPLPHIARAVSPLSAATMSSGTSALLAKRLGRDRAAALALDPRGRRRAHQGMLSPDSAAGRGMGSGTLPQTPSWQPKLTPTRHGDDLYLKVQ